MLLVLHMKMRKHNFGAEQVLWSLFMGFIHGMSANKRTAESVDERTESGRSLYQRPTGLCPLIYCTLVCRRHSTVQTDFLAS